MLMVLHCHGAARQCKTDDSKLSAGLFSDIISPFLSSYLSLPDRMAPTLLLAQKALLSEIFSFPFLGI